MANNKSLLNSDFKNTIKMTLTTDGNLGVGLINPNYKITATGVIQSKSILGYVVNDFPWKVGLDTWKDDVHLSLGVSNDGLNTGVIQVTGGDLSFNGTSFADSPYNLNLQPGGGNVGIGIQGNPGYPLHVQGQIKTNSIVRADNDFTTGDDVPGWKYYPSGWTDNVPATQIPVTEFQCINSWHIWNNGPSMSWALLPGSAPDEATKNSTRVIKYKIIGKTVHLSFIFSQMEFFGAHEGFKIKLPSFLRPATGDYNFTPLKSYPTMSVSSKIATGRALYIDYNYQNPESNTFTKECEVMVCKVNTLPSGFTWGTTPSSSQFDPMHQDFCLVVRSVFKGTVDPGSYPSGHLNGASGYAALEGTLGALSKRFYDGVSFYPAAPDAYWYANFKYSSLGSHLKGYITYDLL